MSDAAVAEAPEVHTEENPQQPLTAPLEPGLQALIERVLPVDKPTQAEPTVEATPEPEEKPQVDKPPVKEKTEFRLAPEDDAQPEVQKPAAPEVPEITDAMIAAEKSPKKQADMKKFRAAFEALKTENTQLRSAPKAPVEDPGTTGVIEQQRQQIADLSARLERQNLRAHPLFQQQFEQPLQNMAAQAADVVKEAGGDPAALERALSLNGRNKIAALDDIVREVESPFLKEQLVGLINSIDAKQRQMDAALKDSKGLSEKLSRDATIARHQMLQQQEQQLTSILGAVEKGLSEGLPGENGDAIKLEVLNKTGRKGYEWWDEQADEIRGTARDILLKGTPEKMAVAAIMAASCGAYRSLWQAERKARKAAETRADGIEDSEPNLRDRRKPTPAGDEFAPDADLTKVALTRLRRGDFNAAA